MSIARTTLPPFAKGPELPQPTLNPLSTQYFVPQYSLNVPVFRQVTIASLAKGPELPQPNILPSDFVWPIFLASEKIQVQTQRRMTQPSFIGIPSRNAPYPPIPPAIGDITILILRTSTRAWNYFTQYAIYPLSRSAQLGTRMQCKIRVTGAVSAMPFTPTQFDQVAVYVGTYLFFLGYIDSAVEKRPMGASFTFVDLNCLDFSARLAHIFFRGLAAPNAPVPTENMGDFLGAGGVSLNFSIYSFTGFDIDITPAPGTSQPVFIKPEKFDTISMLQLCKQCADDFGLVFYMDQFLHLSFISPTGAYYPSLVQTPRTISRWRRIPTMYCRSIWLGWLLPKT